MSLIPAPFTVKKKTYTITPADLPGAIVIDINNIAVFNALFVEDAGFLYDGSVDMTMELLDGTFGNISVNSSANNIIVNGSVHGWFNGNILQFTNIKLPMHFRIKINAQATKGTYAITVFYL